MHKPLYHSIIMKKNILLTLCIYFLSTSISAQSRFVQRTTDVLMVVPSAVGLGKAIVEHDTKGIIQLGLSSATVLALNFGLEAIITKDRPDGTGHHAFPSSHTAIAFNGASFLMQRYGWKWGVPAYALSTYVAWGRVYTKRHDWWDVLGGIAIGVGSAYIYTRPFTRKTDIAISPATIGGNPGIDVAITF